MEMQTFEGPSPGMQQQDKSYAASRCGHSNSNPLSLTFLLIHHVGA